MAVSRRGFLVVGSAVVVALGLDMPAVAAAPYDGMRGRWRDLLTGVGYDPAVAPFTAALAATGGSATRYLADMTPEGDSLWEDHPIDGDSGNVTACFTRLRTMALAWAQPGTGHTGSSTTATAVLDGLRWMLDNAYGPTGAPYDNWWDWEIGSPQRLLDICCLLTVPAPDLADVLAAVDNHVPVSRLATYKDKSTGANRVDLCQVIALRGVLGARPASIAAARDGLSPVFPTVLTGDGLYADGSFLQHTCVPYAGGYGAVLLGGLAKVLHLLAGSTWAVTDPNRQVLFGSVDTAFAPFIHNGLMLDAVSGRGIAREDQDDHQRGHNVMASTLLLANTGLAAVAESDRWRGLVKGWITRDTHAPYLADMAVPDLARAVALLADGGVPAAAHPSSSRVFGAMDRAVHRRPLWTFAVSMHSERTTFYETGNGENLRGWHTGSGMTYWWGDDYGLGQYTDAFWPTVDPYRLPGATASRKSLADAAGGTWNATKPTNTWAGGASDGVAAAVGQHVTGLQSTLTGRKSWFFLDDAVVCLGAGITATDGASVDSVVDNRNLGAAGTHALVVDGATQPTTLPWSKKFTGARWAAIAGFGGYVFLGGATVTASRAARTGSWSAIDDSGSDDPITRRYLALWHDHGTDPVDASYAYLVLPGASSVATSARSASPGVAVVANTAAVQGISAGPVRAANFFAAGACGAITASGPCSVLARQDGPVLSVAVADPTRTAPTVIVTLPDNGFTAASADPGVTVLQTSPTTKLLVGVGGTLGGSRTVRLGAGSPVSTGTAWAIAAAADAYVRDGGSASQNFGTGPLTVKTAAAGYNRRAFVRFDLALPTAPKRAVLWLHGRVNDDDNTHSTVTAHRVTGPWTETGVTWDNQPTLGSVLATARISRTPDWIGLDVTAALTANPSVITFGLSAGQFAVQLDSREATANQPVLQIVT
ncbi:polysaccharide lyase family 8 super-sandwich domain-containing protein [Actinokineospora globicatena]|uniref:polysaccharide lyase family 8 super-sandwich domain-containing protein n=1 Tax=Actinokineospora globicatena TaxID=103729 RepID=UPI0020A421A7|nr:polysaccharide lyase family 8 super-sandwich domain-containing protein [Actinokineospora globicatena]MCP2304838.1 hyaluronate lyase [Actinokineospora globicatena]GLW77784.1 lyase [Actinokineospora globicatena]GLW85548.1 lyase [Actinokineospora globicatena]